MHCANLLFSRFFQPNVSLLEKNDSREVIFNIHFIIHYIHIRRFSYPTLP